MAEEICVPLISSNTTELDDGSQRREYTMPEATASWNDNEIYKLVETQKHL